MSLFDDVASIVSTAVGITEDATAVLFSSTRMIGTVIPDIVIEELHNDELIITDHPVETGAPITDHAFKKPVEVTIKCGFSNSSAQAEGYVQEVYQALISLQATRQPFAITTGKRQYVNMLIRSLGIITDQTSEWALMVTASCREVILVSTSSSGGTATANGSSTSDTSTQANPASTAGTTDGGSQNATPIAPGALSSSSDGTGFGGNTAQTSPDFAALGGTPNAGI